MVSNGVAPLVTPIKSAAESDAVQSKSFRLESISFNSELGCVGATARVTNTSKKKRSATMNVSIFAGDGETVAVSIFGVVNAVELGQTVTPSFTSVSGALPSGKLEYSF